MLVAEIHEALRDGAIRLRANAFPVEHIDFERDQVRARGEARDVRGGELNGSPDIFHEFERPDYPWHGLVKVRFFAIRSQESIGNPALRNSAIDRHRPSNPRPPLLRRPPRSTAAGTQEANEALVDVVADASPSVIASRRVSPIPRRVWATR